MKKFLLFSMVLLLASSVSAKEGMFIPTLLKAVEGDMQTMGLELSAEDIYSINNGSLKDAIVHFNGGCTSELISDKGLLLTNHHCGYSQIQSHSSVENDYLTDGFWAMTLADELANPGLEAIFINRIEDVTSRVYEGKKDGMSTQEFADLMKANRDAIIAEATDGNGLKATIKAFSQGNSYFLIVTKTYTDVRLVGAPPSSVGKFGGDTDNWVWPRHTGDFSMFRIYANADNEPAEFNENNVPFKPAHHLPVSLDGVNEGDFTMVFGFPGRTEQHLTSEAVDYVINKANPMKITMRETNLEILKTKMRSSDKIRIQYAAKQSRISNAWKKWIGQNQGLIELKAMDKKIALEKEFEARLKKQNNTEFGDIVSKINGLHSKNEKYKLAREGFIEYFYYGPEILRYADGFRDLVNGYSKLEEEGKLEAEIDKLKKGAEGYFKNYDLATDQLVFQATTELYMQYIDPSLQPDYLSMINSKFKGSLEKFQACTYEKSIFSSKEKVLSFLSSVNAKKVEKLKKDPAYAFSQSFVDSYVAKVRPEYNKNNTEIEDLMHDYVRLQMELFPEKNFWSDANSTLRLTYGKAEGSAPRDGMMYKFYSTADGILQKHNPDNPDFVLPERLVELLEKGDWGVYGQDGELRVCFTGSNHTTGGNSGSPTLNGKGHLVGLNFDRSWESTMSDILFDPSRCRNIMVDIRYVLFIVDKYAGATHLIDEMTLIKESNEKPEMDMVPEEG